VDPGVLDIQRHLALRPEESARGGEHTVEVERVVRCGCNDTRGYRDAPGCDKCDGGLVARAEVLRVRVPPGVAPGTKLRLRGKGHESLATGSGDLFVAIETTSAASSPRSPRRPWSRADWRVATLVLGGLVAAIGVPCYFASRPPLLDFGAQCWTNGQCGSGMCLRPYESHPIPATDSVGIDTTPRWGVCTRRCAEDSGCPSAMRCVPVGWSSSPLVVIDDIHPSMQACAPK
jgi:hypothetical protein